MKTKKMLLAVVMAALLMVGIMPVGAAESELVTFSADSLERTFTVVSGLELLNGGSRSESYYNTPMQRGDFAGLLAVIAGYHTEARSNAYRDVTPGMKNYNAVCYAVAMDYMAGDKGLFRPEDTVTYGEAVRALVKLSGNDLRQSGAALSAYLSTAATLGLTKGFSGGADAPLSNGAVIRLIYQTLRAPYLEPSTVSGDTIGYTRYSTMLEGLLGYTIRNDLVTATTYTSLYTANRMGSEYIMLGESRYAVKQSWDQYLGYMAEAYIKDENGRQTVQLLVPLEQNRVLELSPSDIASLSEKRELSYYETPESFKTKSIRLDGATSVIFNGVFAGTAVNFSANELILQDADGDSLSGSIKLIDFDGDGVCDVYMLWQYETYFISSANSSKWEYVDKKSEQVLRLEGYAEEDIAVYEDGQPATLSALTANRVISVARAKQGLVTILVSFTVLENALISELSDNGTKVKIDDTLYETNNYFKRYFAKNQKLKLSTGDLFTFYLDAFGKIAVVTEAQDSELHYGYLVNITTPNGLNTRRKVKLYTSMSGTTDFQVYDLASNLLINDRPCRREKISEVPELFTGGTCNDQLVKFSLNAGGELSRLLTADTSHVMTNTDFAFTDHWYADTKFSKNFEGEIAYKSTMDLLGKKYSAVGADANILWVIPKNIQDEDSFMLTTAKGQLLNDTSYQLSIYDVNSDFIPGAIVYRATASATYTLFSATVISDIRHGLDSEGNSVYIFKGYRMNKGDSGFNSTQQTFICQDDTMLDGLEIGDVIQYNSNPYGIVTDVKQIHNRGGGYYTTEPNTNAGTEGGTTYGKLILGSQLLVGATLDGGKTFQIFGKYANLPYVVIDKKTNKVKIETNPALLGCGFGVENAEDVFIYTSYLRALIIVVYR